MEIRRFESPFDCEEVIRLWAEIFGEEEALLEKPQVDGSETAFNRDVVFAAYEQNRPVGTVHATFPGKNPSICGISGMCTHESVRGTGLGRVLFEKIAAEADAAGTEIMFLGTSNPLAAKLYHSCGFSFLPGSNVMARFRNGDRIDMDRKYFIKKPEHVSISAGTPALRIPLIPFVLYRSPHFLLDRNTGIFTSDAVTQVSCMGLYPRYAALTAAGGSWYAACDDETGMPGALLSVKGCEEGKKADFFYTDGFRDAAGLLLDTYAEKEEVCFTVSESDTEKQALLFERGYRETGRTEERIREFTIPCIRFERL